MECAEAGTVEGGPAWSTAPRGLPLASERMDGEHQEETTFKTRTIHLFSKIFSSRYVKTVKCMMSEKKYKCIFI